MARSVARSETRVATVLSPCVCNSLRMATRAVTQLYDDALRPSGLRVTQFSVLAALARVGEASVGELAESLAIDQSTLTRGVALLERRGLTERVLHSDARVKSLRLTARGRAALERARPLWAKAQQTVLRELGPTGWSDARRRLGRLLHVAIERRTATRRSTRTA